LSEAQRLAFLKGREKRMANIEKKRLEKEEAATTQFQLPAAPPKPTKKSVKSKPIIDEQPANEESVKEEPVKEEAVKEEDVKEEIPVKDKPTKDNVLMKKEHPFDEDAFAEKVASKIKETMAPPKNKKPRKTKPVEIPEEKTKVTNIFSWL